MVGASDLVIHGSIVAVNEHTFVLEIKETLVGHHNDSQIEINRFQDWTCSSRWKPYETNQEVIAFIRSLPEPQANSYKSRYALQSAGSEGEFPVIDGNVYYHGYPIAGIDSTNGKPLWGHTVPIDVMKSAIRDYKLLFVLEYDRDKWNQVTAINIVGTPQLIEEYKNRSTLHSYLVESTFRHKQQFEDKER